MTPRTRARVQASGDRLLKWTVALTPLFVSAFAIRQSKEAKEDTQSTAVAVGVLVQDNAEEAQSNQADRKRLLRLEQQFALHLKAEHGAGRRDQVRGRFVGSTARKPAATAEPVTIRSVVGSVVHGIWKFVTG